MELVTERIWTDRMVWDGASGRRSMSELVIEERSSDVCVRIEGSERLSAVVVVVVKFEVGR